MKKKVENFLYEDLSYKIRGALFKVYNTLGFGHKEKVYQKALATELKKRGINFERERALSVMYSGEKVGVYKPDFIVENKIVMEIKAISEMPEHHEAQLLHYLKGTGFKLGFLVNFGDEELDIRRRVWTPNR